MKEEINDFTGLTRFEELDLLKRNELIEIIIDMEKTITKYKDKERQEEKQRPIPDDWRINDNRR